MSDDFGGSIFLPHDFSFSDQPPFSPTQLSSANHGGVLLTNDNNVVDDDNNHHPHYPNNQQLMLTTPVQRKRRGRPPGSKNKPKPPVTITRDSELAIKSLVTLYIPVGCCVIEWILTFARRNHVGVNVIRASGSVESVMLRCATVIPLHGPFTILALHGTLVGGGAVAAPVAIENSYGSVPGYIDPNPGLVYSCPSLGILLEGTQGVVFGGISSGRLVAASPVSVVISTFATSAFQWMPSEDSGSSAEYKEFIDHLLSRLSSC